ncbi:MAG: hypothetical protein ACRCR6_01355, partial [Plesiomonas sp.]
MKKYAAMAVMSVVLAGCASNQPQQSADYQYTPPTPVAITSTGEIAKPYDLTWARAERWLKEHNLAASNPDRGAGLLSVTQTDYVDGLKYLDCGEGGSKVAIANPDVKLNLIITPNGDKSTASVNLKGTSRVDYIDSDGSR